MKKHLRDEEGSVIIMITIVLVVLVGFTALVVDGGSRYLTKSKLQNAADAAALAAAAKLPNATTAKTEAINYAFNNGVAKANTTPTTPYNGDKDKIEVVCQQTVPYTFARIFGSSSGIVTARAVGEANYEWDGDALPFVNVKDDYTSNPELVIWDKDFNGFFASVHENDRPWIEESEYFKLNWQDGIIPKNGEVAKIKDELQILWDRMGGQTVYLFSLKSSIINDPNAKVKFAGGVELSKENINQIPNNGGTDYNIVPTQLVLLECKWTVYSEKDKILKLEYTGNSFDVYGGNLPINYSPPAGVAKPSLIE